MSNEPVTVVVTRRVKAGRERDYEAWLEKLLERAKRLDGYLGTTVTRPSGGNREYTSVFRFDSVEHLRNFEQSDLRREALLAVAELVEADAERVQLTGLESWFTPPAGMVVPQPSRFRMALVMIAVVYGLVVGIGALVAAVLSTAPMPLRLLVTITVEVFLMTYVLMPRLTRWLASWIYPKKKGS
jgi:antibiotic biosynthesis monooxygenase (ABM) superfamily enzyme